MRTTLNIDDDLLRLAKQRAAADGGTLSDLINRAVRRGLAEPATAYAAPPPTLTFGDPAGPLLTSERVAELARQEDDAYLLGKLRPAPAPAPERG